MRKMNMIKSDKHKIYSIEVNKIALSDVDDTNNFRKSNRNKSF